MRLERGRPRPLETLLHIVRGRGRPLPCIFRHARKLQDILLFLLFLALEMVRLVNPVTFENSGGCLFFAITGG